MNAVRRALAVTGLAVALAVGTAVPASATYSDSAAVPTSVSTLVVTAPSSVTIDDRCRGWWYEAVVTWPASTTPRGVVGYRVMAHLNTGQSVVMGETDAVNRTVSARVDRAYLGHQPRISVITLTSYGWTAETPRSAVLSC
ncbi:hypothetical protein [Blastococcus sp. VKM Ac-2987]|uniref:hypothetical protein n=1 Tax=Blastococcus sp. VKM Ac-2987 TaxID=3004141 RepID=UPI0022AB9B9C|nr:hypothetical protein [Blastococcus sp. VKM Ac-2987]MCZ2857717.1 hypothetical protein [Blastococcus sp. VKM Ac-2987]